MKRSPMLALVAGFALAGTVLAQQPRHDPPHPAPGAGHAGMDHSADAHFERHLFPPELIMQQQRNIALTTEQRATVTKAIQELQAKVLDYQWKMEDESQKLAELLDGSTADETAVLAQVDRVLAVEREVKRAHLALLIRIKNALTAEQQTKLAAARDAMQEQPMPR